MKHFTFFLAAVATVAGLAALIAPGPGHARIKPLPGVSRSAIRVITIAII